MIDQFTGTAKSLFFNKKTGRFEKRRRAGSTKARKPVAGRPEGLQPVGLPSGAGLPETGLPESLQPVRPRPVGPQPGAGLRRFLQRRLEQKKRAGTFLQGRRLRQTALAGLTAAAGLSLTITAPAEAGRLNRFGRHYARPVFFNQNTGTVVVGRLLEEEELPEPVRRTTESLKQTAARFDIEKTPLSYLLQQTLNPQETPETAQPQAPGTQAPLPQATDFREANPLYFTGFVRKTRPRKRNPASIAAGLERDGENAPSITVLKTAVLKTVGVENRSHQDILILKDFSFVFYEQFKDFDSSWFHKGFVINAEGEITGVLAALRQNESAESEMFLIKITPEMIKILSQEQKIGGRPAVAKPQDSPEGRLQNQSGGPDGGPGGGSSGEPAPVAIFQDKRAGESAGGLVSRFRQAVAPEGGARSVKPQLLLIKSGKASETPMTGKAKKRDGGGDSERASNKKAKGRIPPFFGPAKSGGDNEATESGGSPPRNNAEARIEQAALRAAAKLNPLTAVPEGGGKAGDCQGLFDPPPQTDR